MKKEKKRDRTFAFDFDGVLAKYDGIFRGAEHLGEPHKDVVEAIRILKKSGHKILIYSTRSSKILKVYCKKYSIPVDYFNRNPNYKTGNPGKPVASVYIDDRALCYTGQNSKKLVGELKNFKPYYLK
jgi:hypothetical protein